MKSLKPMYARIGGKFYARPHLIKHFPKDIDVYIEPFFGAGSMFFYQGKKAPREIVNDLDSNVYKLLVGVKTIPDFNEKLNREISKEYFESIKDSDNPIHIFERYKSSFFSNGRSYNNKPMKRNDGRTGVIRTNIDEYKERLKGTEIYNKDFKEIVNEYKDIENAFWYLDPPYTMAVKNKSYYKHNEITPEDILELVKQIKGRFILSYDDTESVRELFKDYKIGTLETRYSANGSSKKCRKVQEIFIKNF
jgi:DNA adenine methylase